MLGVTIEPESVTELRVDHAKLQEKTLFLEEELKTCRTDLAARDAKKGARQSQKGGK